MPAEALPNLGCATTRELLQEIKARGEISYAGDRPEDGTKMIMVAEVLLDELPQSILDYRIFNA